MTGAGIPAEDEFRFLPADAERVGRSRPLPKVRRIGLPDGEGRTVSALAFAPDSSPELVVLHGAGLNAHSFDPMLLSLDRPALALDLPGHGRSDWREDADYLPQTIAPAVAQALAAAGVTAESPVHLVGHSLGGLVAAIVAAMQPQLVSRLTLIDITPGIAGRSERESGDPDQRPDADSPDASAAPSAVAEFITGQRDYGSVEEMVDRAIRFGIGTDRASLTRGVSLNTRRRPDGRLEWTHHLAHLSGLPGAGSNGGSGDSSTKAATGDDPAAPLWHALAGLSNAGLPLSLVRASRGMVDDALEAEWRERLPLASVTLLDGPHNLHEACPSELAAALTS